MLAAIAEAAAGEFGSADTASSAVGVLPAVSLANSGLAVSPPVPLVVSGLARKATGLARKATGLADAAAGAGAPCALVVPGAMIWLATAMAPASASVVALGWFGSLSLAEWASASSPLAKPFPEFAGTGKILPVTLPGVAMLAAAIALASNSDAMAGSPA